MVSVKTCTTGPHRRFECRRCSRDVFPLDDLLELSTKSTLPEVSRHCVLSRVAQGHASKGHCWAILKPVPLKQYGHIHESRPAAMFTRRLGYSATTESGLYGALSNIVSVEDSQHPCLSCQGEFPHHLESRWVFVSMD